MKQWLCALLAVLLLCGVYIMTHRTAPEKEMTEIRAVWISYPELSMKGEDDRSEKAFREKAETMCRNIAENGMNTVFLHVRPCSDAFYRSEIYPFSEYLTGKEGENPGYDPLEIFCDLAEKYDLSLHAWINPFRICSVRNRNTRAAENPMHRLSEIEGCVIEADGGLYYNPAAPQVQALILDGVRELLQNYPVDGVHIDDYFYPTTDDSADALQYADYRKSGGVLSRDAWRRDTVNRWIRAMYSAVKSFGADKIFSISPCADIRRNTETLYADVAEWAEAEDCCDWLIPQLYVGLEHESLPFVRTAEQWQALTKSDTVRLIFGLSVYKSGTEDRYAGTGSREWLEHTDILSRQLQWLRSSARYDGFALYSYSYAFGENTTKYSESEIKNLIDVL